MSGLAACPAVERLQPAWSDELPEAVASLAWIDDDVLVGAADGNVRRYAADGRLAYQLALHSAGVTRLQPRPDAQAVASAGEDGRVLLWAPGDGKLLAELANESAWIEHLAWSSDGHTLAAAAEKTIYLWRDSESLGVWYDARRRVLAMAWAPDGKRLATAANKGLYLWRIGGQEPVQLLEFPGAPVAVAWEERGAALAVGTQDGFLQIWQQGKSGPARQLTMRGYPGKVACLDWHPSQPLIATAGGPEIVLWPTREAGGARNAQPLRAHGATVTALAYAPDASLLISGDRAGRICVWGPGGVLLQVEELRAEITTLVWSSDSTRCVCGTANGLLQLYAVPTGAPG